MQHAGEATCGEDRWCGVVPPEMFGQGAKGRWRGPLEVPTAGHKTPGLIDYGFLDTATCAAGPALDRAPRAGGGGALTTRRLSPRRPGLHYGYVCVQNAGGALLELPEADLTRLAGYPSGKLLPAGCSVRPKPDPQAYTLRLVLFAEGLAWFLPPRLGGFGAGGVLAAALFDRAPADGFDHRWRPDAATYSAVAAAARAAAELAAGDGAAAAIVAAAAAGLAQRCVDPRPPQLAAELARLASLAPAQQRAEREALPPELRRYLSLEQAATPPGPGGRNPAPGRVVRVRPARREVMLCRYCQLVSVC
jgi:hypothetical protein